MHHEFLHPYLKEPEVAMQIPKTFNSAWTSYLALIFMIKKKYKKITVNKH